MKISIIIPTYHEKEIASILDRLFQFLNQHPQFHFQVIVIDDSPPEIFQLLKIYKLQNPKKDLTLVQGNQQGKGGAVKKAVGFTQGEITFLMDADLRIPLENIVKFICQIESESIDIVMAERPFHRNWKKPNRLILSAGLFILQRLFIFNSFRFFDTQCGFKAFKSNTLKSICKLQQINGGMFDVEYLYIATINHLRISKMAVVLWEDLRNTKIKLWKCLFRDPVDLLTIKLNGVLGKYKLDCSQPQVHESALQSTKWVATSLDSTRAERTAPHAPGSNLSSKQLQPNSTHDNQTQTK